ncbi:unnamed protein product [Acanthoscelides obtectus]|uniref:Gag-like protein n=1 Tax=Acanthoscelides obtectus TaxID=200917 RepID=A0A9P0KBI8_ACAOB|nr:unnamed protein product [Acanthoscelides obtectus]CAK1680137.1 Nucleic-acid-binding protein from transposon X-element [Acanthoscelides obtectus]
MDKDPEGSEDGRSSTRGADSTRTAAKIGKQDENPAVPDDSSNSTIQMLTTITEKQARQIQQQAQQIADQADLIKSLNHSSDRLTAQVTALNTQLSRNSRSDSLQRRPENQDPIDDDALSDDSVRCDGFTPARQRKRQTTTRHATEDFPPLPTQSAPTVTHLSQINTHPLIDTSHITTSHTQTYTSAAPSGYASTVALQLQPRRITPVVLREPEKWRNINYQFISLGIKIDRAVAEGDYRKIIRHFKEQNIVNHTFPLPSERNIHAVLRGIPASLNEEEIKQELNQKGYTPLIRLKRSGGTPMSLVVVMLPKIEKSHELFNETELLGLSIEVEVQINNKLIGQCHSCQMYGHAQSYCTASPKCVKCAQNHLTHLCPQTRQEVRKCANCGDGHAANSPTCRCTPKKNLQVIAERRNKSYAEITAKPSAPATSAAAPAFNSQQVDLVTALKSLQQIITPLISA